MSKSNIPYPLVVFSKSWCPYCKATKSLLSSLDVDFKTVELDQECKLLPPTTHHDHPCRHQVANAPHS